MNLCIKRRSWRSWPVLSHGARVSRGRISCLVAVPAEGVGLRNGRDHAKVSRTSGNSAAGGSSCGGFQGEAANARRTFHRLVKLAELTPRSTSCRPRMHDLRHSFAVHAYTAGQNGHARLTLLSTWLCADPSRACPVNLPSAGDPTQTLRPGPGQLPHRRRSRRTLDRLRPDHLDRST